jgi:formate dehydrogenase subunit gamma
MSDQTLIERGDAIEAGDPPMVDRYRLGTRINHWVGAVAMVLLVLSGLSMFDPSLFFLSYLFGGGGNDRALHPWLGIILFVSTLILFFQVWRSNFWNRSDTAWVEHVGDLIGGREEKMPEVGKYNAGQKFVFWTMMLLILFLFASGLVIWDRYFEDMTSIQSQRFALEAHAIAAVLVILVLILHVYAAIWVRGSFDAMIKGKVSAAWAWRHHRKWFRALAGKTGTGPAE